VLVLLPPSEAKTSPATGAPVDLSSLGSVRLTQHRAVVLEALIKVSAHPDALRILGVGASLAAQVERNTRLRVAAAGPASSVYSGVLYAAAGLDRLPNRAARDRADRSVRIVSGLWGLVRPADRIPAYRLAMATDLPGVGPLARAWRAPLGLELDARAGELVVDCRSAAYLAPWHPPVDSPRWVVVRVLRELAGRRTVVSHEAKRTRGLLTRHLLTRPGAAPSTPAQLLAAARELVGAELLAAELVPAALPPARLAPADRRGVHGAARAPSRGAHVLTLTVA